MVFVSETSGDLLRRPTSLEVDPDIVHQERGFETRSTMALLPAKISLRLGLVRQVAVRCAMIGVPAQFPRDCRGRSAELGGNGSDRVALTFDNRQVITLFFGQLLVVFRHNPRILARKRFSWKCCTCLLNSGKGQHGERSRSLGDCNDRPEHLLTCQDKF